MPEIKFTNRHSSKPIQDKSIERLLHSNVYNLMMKLRSMLFHFVSLSFVVFTNLSSAHNNFGRKIDQWWWAIHCHLLMNQFNYVTHTHTHSHTYTTADFVTYSRFGIWRMSKQNTCVHALIFYVVIFVVVAAAILWDTFLNSFNKYN